MSQAKDYRTIVTTPEVGVALAASINQLQEVCHGLAVQGGWWEPKGNAKKAAEILKDSGQPISDEVRAVLMGVASEPRNPLELIALIQSEASEALEGVRKNQMDDKLPHRKMEEVEMADIIVRVLDYCGGRGLDVGGALVEKLVFNITREDHQPENRAKLGGKAY